MGQIVEIVKAPDQEMQESQHRDLEMYRKLHCLEVFTIQGANDEECEQSWLQMLGVNDTDVIFVAEPGLDAKQ